MRIKFKTVNTAIILAVLLMSGSMTSCKKKGCTDSEATNYNSSAKKDDGLM